MKTFFSKLGRFLLPVVAAASLSGCAVYESSPPYTTVTNPDGTQSTVPYACPEGYTCNYPEAQGTHTTVYAYDPYPYVWPLAFLGLGYTFGHYYHHHYPRWYGWGGWGWHGGWGHGWRGRGPHFGGPRHFGRGFPRGGGFGRGFHGGGRGFGGFHGGGRGFGGGRGGFGRR